MRKSFLWTALVATVGVLTQSVLAANNVLSLDESNFKDHVANEELTLIKFYAPWCGHCQALAPEYEVAATVLKSKNIKLAKVDCTENADLCQEHGILGYPTIKVFRNGSTTDYKGGRKASNIVSYMTKQAAPALTEVDSEHFEEFKTSDRIVVTGFVAPSDASSLAALSAAAEHMREEYIFGVVTDEELAKKEDVETLPTLVVYKKFDSGREDQVGNFETEAIEQFVTASAVPLFGEIDSANFKSYIKNGLPLAYLFVDSEETREPLLKELKPLTEKYRGKVTFVHIDTERYASHGVNLGLDEQWPAFAIQDVKTGAKFPFDQSTEINFANVESFVEDFLTGALRPTLRSEEPPAENNGPIKIVVGTEYDAIVRDPTKDVLLMLYASWCQHSKRLEPTLVELGQLVQDQGLDSKLVIAKMEGTENDLPQDAGYQIHGFPTVKFFKAETNEFFDYLGDRSLEDLVKFINSHTSQAYKVELPAPGQTEDSDTAVHDEL